jgi:hypothetical protein
MDLSCGGGIEGAIGAFAKGAPLRIIGSEMIGSPDTYWYVVANSPIHSLKDASGKTISYSQNGSSSHAALLSLLELSRNVDLAITPDGPRGPAGQVSGGILMLAQRTGLPILPVSCRADRAWHFRSWDRFMIPRPFSRVEVRFGEPLRIPQDLDAEAMSATGRRLQEGLACLSDGP